MPATDSKDILARNLAALRRVDPALAERIETTAPASLEWSESKKGPLTASIDVEGRKLALASRYDPQAEAEKLTKNVDLQKVGGIVVLGLGIGYHVNALLERMDEMTLLIVHEPDLSLLRAVLERIDHSPWLGQRRTIIADTATDRSAILRRLEGFTAIITQGTELVTHPPTRQRYPEAVKQFGEVIVEILAYCRTQVATSLVNASRTHTNFAMNLGAYAAGATTDDLHNAAQGFPAVCVSAGPSLAKNIDLLRDPKVRNNVIVITAQTTLKVLLARGIRPDFVTALDYAAISKRFYEDLPPLDDVTLIAEPLAHHAILDSFPGPVRLTQSKYLDRVLGDLASPRINVPYGATVAHLSLYVAQHLGCDPIMLIGQDLGFSDGLYYCPGTAIHDVWMPELGPFNTLENMEWQRVVRHRGHLQRFEDVNGKPIYSDEQMVTYLRQFERDFAAASQTILDCTEGGVPKAHTTQITLADALAQHATRPTPQFTMPEQTIDIDRLRETRDRLQQRIDQVRELRKLSNETIPLLKKMINHQRDRKKMDRLFDKVDARRRKVDAMPDVFAIVNDLNTMGQFKRHRADRAIHHADDDEFSQQKARLQRDIINVEWIVQACEETLGIFNQSMKRIDEQLATCATPVAASA